LFDKNLVFCKKVLDQRESFLFLGWNEKLNQKDQKEDMKLLDVLFIEFESFID
jgi:hypothetical protein